MLCQKSFTLTVEAVSTCPDWTTLIWSGFPGGAAPFVSTLGAGTASGVLAGENFQMGADSPSGTTDTASAGAWTNPDPLVYNGPGCNCNLHVDWIANGGLNDLTGSAVWVVQQEGPVLLASIEPPTATGVYDIPFSLPDTLGLDIHLYVLVVAASGQDIGNPGPSSSSIVGFIENLP